MRLCGAKTRSGGKCRQAVKAGGRCHYHGGNAPQTLRAQRRRDAALEVREMVDRYALPVETTPEEAIVGAVWSAAGNVELLSALVADLQPTQGGLYGLTGSTTKPNEAEPHVLVRMYDAERDRLVRFAEVAAKLEISEALVRIAERQGQLLARVVDAALEDRAWGLTKEQKATGRELVGKHLRLVAGGDER